MLEDRQAYLPRAIGILLSFDVESAKGVIVIIVVDRYDTHEMTGASPVLNKESLMGIISAFKYA